MKKLLDLYKNLPPELRSVLALLGLGAPAGLIYFAQRHLGWSLEKTIIAAALLIGAICLVTFVVTKLFGSGAGRRRKKMEQDLVRGAESGLVSMDKKAEIKANTEKFFKAINDMRKNLRISVYDLPWYIVLGDSGCGKTRLINEGGLTFAMGKPEGYQLGTLNYNWWLSDEAVFIDMAGRLCNPQEDGDRREWSAFLDTIAKGRKGYPINGAIACVSAEHLLQDPPEKIEQDANIMLERLRDLQNKLGVTFATYLVITKCDKILGFMQFFDRAERDVTLKHQMFGWSRPGDYSESYDPEAFANDFHGVYARLNDLRLRRLNDDADEIELGLAYSFPEEFRQLRDPLQTYVRLLFPMMKNPRAVKNLIFRGVYFTSATQQGEVILKHLTSRLGPEAAGSFAPLESLYPQPKPHFVKDLLFKKVFPEHGLVFRNQQQVLRNQRLSKLLRFGSVAMTLLLFGLLGLSYYKFNHVIGGPKETADQSKPADVQDAAVALERAAQLGGHTAAVRDAWLWRALLGGFAASDPVRHLEQIRLSLVHKRVIPRILDEVGEALRSTTPAEFDKDAAGKPLANPYLEALAQYVRWDAHARNPAGSTAPAGAAGDKSLKTAPELASLKAMSRIVPSNDAFVKRHGETLWQTGDAKTGEGKGELAYFLEMAPTDRYEGGSIAMWMKDNPLVDRTLQQAVGLVADYLRPYAELKAFASAPLQEWMRIRDCCAEVDRSYKALLASKDQKVDTQEEFKKYKDGFLAEYAPEGKSEKMGFKAALQAVAWKLGNSVPDLKSAIREQRNLWTSYQKRLQDEYQSDEAKNVFRRLTEGDGSQAGGLDGLLLTSLEKRDLTLADCAVKLPDVKVFSDCVQEVNARYEHILLLEKNASNVGTLSLTADAKAAQKTLDDLWAVLSKTTTDPADDLGAVMSADGPTADTKPADEIKLADAKWQADGLGDLRLAVAELCGRAEETRLLNTISTKLASIPDWGAAELMPRWCEPTKSAFSMAIPDACDKKAADAPRTEAKPAEPARPRTRSFRSGGNQPQPEKPDFRTVRAAPVGENQIPAAADHDFWNNWAEEYLNRLIQVQGLDAHFTDVDRAAALARMSEAGQKYVDTFLAEWLAAYERQVEQVRKVTSDRANSTNNWNALKTRMVDKEEFRANLRQIKPLIAELLENARWLTFKPEVGYLEDDVEVTKWWDLSLQPVSKNYGFLATENRRQLRQKFELKQEPWNLVADAFEQRWTALWQTVGKVPDLRQAYDNKLVIDTRLPWGKLQELRAEWLLTDEKLTGELVAAETQARLLLSAEMTQILHQIQDKYFGGQTANTGWPYLSDAKNPLATISIDKLIQFLDEVDQAERVFKTLEEDLAKASATNDECVRARRQFYDSCREWRAFLKLNDSKRTTPISLSIERLDPMVGFSGAEAEQRDTAQNYYAISNLGFGFASVVPEDNDGPQRIPTSAEGYATKARAYASKPEVSLNGKITGKWDLQATGSGNLVTVSLERGLPLDEQTSTRWPDVNAPLGSYSGLSMCAYFALYTDSRGAGKAVNQGTTFEKEHWFDLKTYFAANSELLRKLEQKRKTIVGVKLRFTLDRALPAPIVPLQLCPSVSGAVARGN